MRANGRRREIVLADVHAVRAATARDVRAVVDDHAAPAACASSAIAAARSSNSRAGSVLRAQLQKLRAAVEKGARRDRSAATPRGSGLGVDDRVRAGSGCGFDRDCIATRVSDRSAATFTTSE